MFQSLAKHKMCLVNPYISNVSKERGVLKWTCIRLCFNPVKPNTNTVYMHSYPFKVNRNLMYKSSFCRWPILQQRAWQKPIIMTIEVLLTSFDQGNQTITVSTSTMEALAMLVGGTTYEGQQLVQRRNTRFASCVQVWPDLHRVVIYVSWQFQSG